MLRDAAQGPSAHPSPSPRRSRPRRSQLARPELSIPLAYAAASIVWIAFSDRVVEVFVPDPAARAAWNTAKGVAFVVLTAVALALLLRRALARERAARQVLRRYQLLAEHGRDIMVFVSAEDGRVLEANAAAAEAYGYTREELKALTIFDLRAEATLGASISQITAADTRGLRFETVHRRRDGTTFPAEVSSYGAWVEGKRTLLSIVRDVSARKAAEQDRARMSDALNQAAKMEAVGRLAGGIAHDFNNLLTVILSCAGELRREAALGRAANGEDLSEITTAAERARDLTRQLLTFARSQVARPVPLDLNESLRTSERLLKRLLGGDVDLALSLHSGLWAVRCDPGQFEQVVMNLAVNALDAMPGGGVLAIETANLVVGDRGLADFPGMPRGEYVRFAVRDTGVGMPAEIRERIFEPFFTTKAVGKGSGLGLATTYGIVQGCKGFIRVESEPGAGTTFEICLPRSREAPAGTSEA